VLRVVEVTDARAHCPVRFRGEDRDFQPVNLLEEPARPGDEWTLRVNPYEISTVRLPIKRGR
jgi:hypothetical protein